MQPWWEPRGVLRRFVIDLLADEMARLRRAAVPQRALWRDELLLDADLRADSLELMALATALGEAVHLHESGIEDFLLARRTLGDWVDIAQTGLARHGECLTFRTSGSTGQPKPCTHALATLLQEVDHLATLLPGCKRVLCAVPCHHIYGFLFSVLLPPRLELDGEEVLDLRASTPAWLGRGAQPGDLVIGHPDFWQSVARTVPRLPPGVTGITSTAPCPDALAEAVQEAGIGQWLDVYGSTETAGIAARTSHREPYALFPYWRTGDDGALLRRMPDGGDAVYWLQDRLQDCGAGRFRVGPRRDNAVQVGGINVFPARVIDVLKKHPAVQDAAVRLMRPEEGTRLKALVVPRAGYADGEDLLSQLRGWIERELAAPERPKAIRIADALPVTGTGKPADWDLRD